MRRCGKRIRRVLCQSHHRRDQTSPQTKAPVISATSSPRAWDDEPRVPFEGLLKVDGLKRVPLGVFLSPRISELLSELAWLRERAKGASDDTRALINQYQTILRDSAAGHVHPQLTEVRKLSKRARFHLEPVDLAKNLRLEVSCGSREGPTVCRLPAGGRWIRTFGPG
jgi:hypothetical protein